MSTRTRTYHPDHFAARKAEIDLIRKKLTTARPAAGDQRLLVEFFGVPGVGKSWLLHHLKETLRSTRVVTALVDFAGSNREEQVITGLFEQIREQIPDIAQESASSAESLISMIKKQTDSRVFLLLFDTSERSSPLIDRLEDRLVYPLLRIGRVVFVFAGRRWLCWKRFEVKRRVDTRELKPFDRERDTPEQLEKLNVDRQLAAILYPYSFGHPLATRAIIDAFQQRNLPITAETLEKNQNVISEAIHQVIQDRLYEGVKDELDPFLELACIPRQFDVTPLKAFAARFYPDQGYEHQDGSYYLDLIRDLQDTTLVQWNSDWGGYILLPVLRWIMAKNLSMRDPGRFKEWHKQAAEQYREWVDRHPRDAVRFLIEWGFHRAWALHAEGQRDEQLGKTVAQNVQQKWDEIKKTPEVQWDLTEMTETLKKKVDDNEFKTFFPVLYGQIAQWANQLK